VTRLHHAPSSSSSSASSLLERSQRAGTATESVSAVELAAYAASRQRLLEPVPEGDAMRQAERVVDVFLEAQREILKLMHMDAYPRFRVSRYFRAVEDVERLERRQSRALAQVNLR
jgi:predicted nucleic acid-binding protein